MIEATSENIWYKKKKRRFKLKRFFSLIIIILILTCCYLFYNYAVCGQIINICKDYAYSCSTDSVNKAVLTSLSDKLKYEELVFVEKNKDDDISLMTINTLKVNSINREISQMTKTYIEQKLEKGTPVPLFAFTGIAILAGYGNSVNVKTLSITSVISQFDSKFKSVGINQTLHSIYINVNSKILIEMPFRKEEVNCSTSVMLCESILVGKVPQTYLGGNLFS